MTRVWVAAALLLGVAPNAHADDLRQIIEKKRLIWGGDQEGGGPFIYPRDDQPDEVTGFEVELAQRLAEKLDVRAQFQQGNWDKLTDLLRVKKIDLVLNGYEWSAVRAASFEASIPYYVYALQFLVERTNFSVRKPSDLALAGPSGKRRIGVLSGSAAEKYVLDNFGESVEMRSYDGSTDAMRDVETGKLDATLQDTPVVAFYGRRFPQLRPLGEPVAPGYYVALVRKGEYSLIRQVNAALLAMLFSGELEEIYRRYGIWDDQQHRLLSIAAEARFFGYLPPAGDASSPVEGPEVVLQSPPKGWEVVRRYGGTLLSSAGMTVLLSVLSFPLALAAGLFIALGRIYGPRWLNIVLTSWVELIRGTPLMLQLYFIFYFLPEVGITFPPIFTAVLGLATNYAAYESEIHRAGLQAVAPGQMEAALSLGLTKVQALRHVVVPQALRIVIPPVVNDFITLFKDTSVCSVVTVIELTKRFSVLAMSTQAVVEMMLMTALLYLVMSYPLSLAARRMELSLGGVR